MNQIKHAAKTDLNSKNIIIVADLAQYMSVNLEEIFFSMKSDVLVSELSDSMQVCIMWEINSDFHSLLLKQIVMYENMCELTVIIKSKTLTMIVWVRIVLFNVLFQWSFASLCELSQSSDIDVEAVKQTWKILIYKILLRSHLNKTHMMSVNLYDTLQDLNMTIFQHVKSYSLNVEQIMTIHYMWMTRESVTVIQEFLEIRKTFFQMISTMSLIVNLCHELSFDHTSCHYQFMMTA